MSLLSGIAFANPWLLAALVVLPAIWLLLRVTPPAPERITFPPARLIFEMTRREETPARTPWWLLLLRMLIAALVIAGLARPLLNAAGELPGSGPVVLVVDDGWAAAQDWNGRIETLESLTRRARRDDRAVILLRTTPTEDGLAPAAQLMTATEALARTTAMTPRAWGPDRVAAANALGALQIDSAANVFWISDGLAGPGDEDMIEAARRLGTLTVFGHDAPGSVMLMRPVRTEGARLVVRVERSRDATAEPVAIRVVSNDGRALLRRPVTFEPGEAAVSIEEDLPVEALNDIARVMVEGHEGAGGVALVDSGIRRYRVGLTASRSPERSQPLLSDNYYLDRALQPFAEVLEGEIDSLLSEPLSMLVLPDVGRLVDADRIRLEDWIEKGGVLVRFAGPRLAENADSLIPVSLRQGDRALQGAMSWSTPARLATFAPGSPFLGLSIPEDVLIRRQVLAEPTVDLVERTWARLQDGTPLVTGTRRGKGWLVLVHTTANTAWSNLPLSGLFVDMLRRLSGLSSGVETGTDAQRPLNAISVLDGFGRATTPGPAVRPIIESDLATARAGPAHPPGLYGDKSGPRALNVGMAADVPVAVGSLPPGIREGRLGPATERDLGPWLLLAALLLLLTDFVIALALRGHLRIRRLAFALPAGLVLLAGLPDTARAQEGGQVDASVIPETLETRIAYVLTGDAAIDRMSAAGMFGLSEILRARTSVEPEDAVAIDIEKDELIFYPLVYWPMVPAQAALSDEAARRVDRYLRTGGIMLFDTRDDGAPTIGRGQVGPGTQRLRELLARIDVGPLVPVEQGHVLTRSFYLADSFPGRYSGGRVWVERLGNTENDGVSPLVIGGADWAAAWAMDGTGRPVATLVPGSRRQREDAYRFGVNLVMYALTGNYKSDQVHLPAILERLGQ
ncbi:MAG: DUF4159 domain-containing protein [Pseudomonadota bacterium]|nr:DUF4159 domain-containing protein [Pseudomonadota bacterium]